MKKTILASLALALSACGASASDAPRNMALVEKSDYDAISIYHDQKRSVTCYLPAHGIACIPDVEIYRSGGKP